MKISKVEIQAFRAYQELQHGTFDFTVEIEGKSKPANLISIFAPNGFGKSSFYDAVEWAFTNSVHRYVDSIYESAAKSSKQKGQALDFLRNTYAPTKLKTTVSVHTSAGVICNELLNSKRIDMDMKGKNRFAGTDHFKKIFLSQDSIDRFIRGVTAEERYHQFMSMFGDENEITRRNLQALATENDAILASIAKQISAKELLLRNRVDNSFVDTFYETTAQINLHGQPLNFIPRDIKNLDFEGFSDEINKLTLSTKSEINRLFERSERITNLIDQNSEISKIAEDTKQHRARESLLEKSIVEVRRLDSASELINKLSEERVPLEALSSKHANMATMLPAFEALNANRTQALVSKSQSDALVQSLRAKIDAAEESESRLERTLNSTADALQSWHILKDGAPAVFSRISLLQSQIDFNKSQEAKQTPLIARYESELEGRVRKLRTLADIPPKLSLMMPEDITSLSIDPSIVSQFNSAQAKRSFAIISARKLEQQIQNLQSQSNLFEKLISLGHSVVLAHPSDTCPLCHSKFLSTEELKSAIESKSGVSAALQNALAELSSLQLSIKNFETEVSSIDETTLKIKLERLTELEAAAQSISTILEEQKQLAASRTAETSALEDELSQQRAIVLNSSEEVLAGIIESSIKSRLSELEQAHSAIDLCRHELQTYKSELERHSTSSLATVSLISAIEADPIFKFVVEYMAEHGYAQQVPVNFLEDRRIDIEQRISNIDRQIQDLRGNLISSYTSFQEKGLPLNLPELLQQLTDTKNSLSKSFVQLATYIRQASEVTGIEEVEPTKVLALLTDQASKIQTQTNELEQLIQKCTLARSVADELSPYIEQEKLRSEVASLKEDRSNHERLQEAITADIKAVNAILKKQIDHFFHTDLINKIYSKIDPHPTFKNIKFETNLQAKDKPALNVVITEAGNDKSISPLLYFSAAQLNILSLSIFLASALNATTPEGKPLDTILIDDPIHSMDSINILSTIDLFRIISSTLNKQIIISTHDENFYELLKRKIPVESCSSKFLKLTTFGKVSVDLH